MKDLTTIEKVESAVDSFVELIKDVPFGNSDYQNRKNIVGGEMTPLRAYRHAALRIMNRLEALVQFNYDIKKADIEFRKLQRDYDNETDELEKELIQLEMNKMNCMMPYSVKLANDAIQEIESLYPVIESLGHVERQDFEDEEIKHYKIKHGHTTNMNDLFRGITGLSLEDVAKEKRKALTNAKKL